MKDTTKFLSVQPTQSFIPILSSVFIILSIPCTSHKSLITIQNLYTKHFAAVETLICASV